MYHKILASIVRWGGGGERFDHMLGTLKKTNWRERGDLPVKSFNIYALISSRQWACFAQPQIVTLGLLSLEIVGLLLYVVKNASFPQSSVLALYCSHRNLIGFLTVHNVPDVKP